VSLRERVRHVELFVVENPSLDAARGAVVDQIAKDPRIAVQEFVQQLAVRRMRGPGAGSNGE